MMHPAPRGLRPDPAATPADPRSFGDALDLIAEEHLQAREICALLDRVADRGAATPEEAERARAFLGERLELHLADEREDLFPLLRRRCTAEDEIARILDRLEAEHADALAERPAILALLAEAPAPLDPAGRDALSGFARRARLTRADLAVLTQHMRSRRGLPPNTEYADAQ
jgi:hypothetical protein